MVAAAGACWPAAAALAVRRPAWVPLAVLAGGAAAPADRLRVRRRLPDLDRRGRPARAAAAALLRARPPRRWRWPGGSCARMPGAARALPRVVALPAAAFIAFACLSLAWADRLAPAAELLHVLHRARSRCCWPWWPGRRSPTGRRARWRGSASAWASLFAAVGPLPGRHARAVLLRAQPRGVERQLRLLPRHVAVRRPEPLRAPRGAGHGHPARGAGAAAGRPAPGHRAAGGDVGRPVLLLLAVEHGGADRRDAGRGRRHGRPAGAAGGGGRPGGRAAWSGPATWPRSRSAATRCGGRRATAPSASRTRCAWCARTRSWASASAARPPASRAPRRRGAHGPPDAELRVAHHPAHRGRRARRRRAGPVRLAARGRRAGDRRRWRGSTARSGSRSAPRCSALFVHALFYSGFLEDPLTWLVLAVAAGPAHLGRGATTACTAPPRRRGVMDRLGLGGRLSREATFALLGVLLALLAITLPELGSDPWPFRPGAVDPQGVLAPLVRAAGEEWDVGIARAACFLAALVVALLAAWSLRAARLARVGRRGAGRVRGAGAAGALDAAAGRAARRHRAVVPHQRLDLPDRDRRGPAARRREPLRRRLPLLGHGALLHPRRQRVRAGARARGGARALRLLPRHRRGRRRVAAGALAPSTTTACSCC